MTIIDDYLEYQKDFVNKYGDLTIVMMQVGHFFEAYGVDNNEEKSNSENLYRLSDIMNIQMTRKNKKITENSRKNPLMIGFNLWSVNKYIQILTSNNYTVVIMEQDRQGPNCDRNVTNVISPGINLEYCNKYDSNNLVSIFIESSKSHMGYNNIVNCGLSCIDITTGKNSVYEVHTDNKDKNLVLDEIFRFIQIHNPKEVIFYTKNLNTSENELVSYLDMNNRKIHYKNDSDIDSKYFNLNYQKEFLKKIFTKTGLLSVIEYIDLESKPFGIISYLMVLDFAYQHNENIIRQISKPEICDSTKYLILTNNTINQLNVVNHNSNNFSGKYDSLFSVVNQNSTAIGKRMLKNKILNPIIDIEKLNSNYDLTEYMMNQDNQTYKYKEFESYLIKINDIERLHRKISLGVLQPADFGVLDISYKNILKMLNIIKSDSDNFKTISNLLPKDTTVNKLKEFMSEYTSIFDLDNIIKYHLDKIDNSFFNIGYCENIDKLQNDIDNCNIILKNLSTKLSNYIEKDSKFIKLDCNEKNGHYLYTTDKRAQTLISRLKNLNSSFNIIDSRNNNISINPKDISLKDVTKSSTKVYHKLVKENSNKLIDLHDSMKELSAEIFIEKLKYFDEKYISYLSEIIEFVGNIDNIKSNAKCSINFNYNRPIIEKSDSSFCEIKGIRHPIIERINDDIEYVTNDITLGKKLDGMLLFGTNASGKSSLMKAVGLNIIMAQAGLFCSCSQFKYYPYNYIFSRINNNDNIFKGESSFAVEMSELRSILKRSNKFSIVLGDELCSGTESVSAQSIFCSSVVKLSERKCNFIFATHLHELCKLEEIKILPNIEMFHLKVIFDKENDKLIYDRKLEKGSGPAIYGLEVCKAMDMDDDFLMLANKIRKKILNIDENFLEENKSHFNSKILIDNCKICDIKATEVHHIKFQSEANEDNMINHIHKNNKSNLVSLCDKCHNDVHNNDLVINGYKQTSDGVILDYKYLNNLELIEKKINRKKYTDLQIDIINEMKKFKLNQSDSCNYLKEKHNIQISKSTLSKIWKNQY
jgi:DNA mismatch repair protein MutS